MLEEIEYHQVKINNLVKQIKSKTHAREALFEGYRERQDNIITTSINTSSNSKKQGVGELEEQAKALFRALGWLTPEITEVVAYKE